MPDHAAPDGPDATPSPGTDDEYTAAERQLTMVDQVIGLRARLAEDLVRHQVTVFKLTESYEQALEKLHQARTADAELRAALAAATAEIEVLRADLHASRTADAELRVQVAELERRLREAAAETTDVRDSLDFKVGQRLVGTARRVRGLGRSRRSP